MLSYIHVLPTQLFSTGPKWKYRHGDVRLDLQIIAACISRTDFQRAMNKTLWFLETDSKSVKLNCFLISLLRVFRQCNFLVKQAEIYCSTC